MRTSQHISSGLASDTIHFYDTTHIYDNRLAMDDMSDEQLDVAPLDQQEEVDVRTHDLRVIMALKGRDQRVIFLVTLFLSVFFLVLLVHAIIARSTSLVPIAFIQLMHAGLLFVTLVADYFSGLGPDERHTYGYGRSTIVCCFAVSLSIILFALSLLLEALKRFLSEAAAPASEIPSLTGIFPHVLPLLVYCASVFLLRGHARHPTQSRTPHLHAAFLVLASGAMHSLAHFATGLVPFLLLPDDVTVQAAPLFHGLVALFIIDRAWLLIGPAFLVLMQATPARLLDVIDKRLGETVIARMIREASHFEGVLECKSPHFWGLTFTDYVGSLHVRAKNDANEQHIIAQVHAKFDPIVGHFTVQVEKDHWDRVSSSASLSALAGEDSG